MGKYVICEGQNLFDIALHIHGSIEGIIDLLICNPSLSLASELKSGNELSYTDDFVIDADIVAYYRTYGIKPANGERTVYYKSSEYPKLVEVYLENSQTFASFGVTGYGTLKIDWGDNSRIETVTLGNDLKQVFHTFDNSISGKRKVSLYGDVSVRQLNLSGLSASAIYLLCPLPVEKFTLQHGEMAVDFLYLLEDTYEADLTGLTTGNLLPLLANKGLMKLNLSGANIRQSVLDEYLINLVKQYYDRRSCHVYLTTLPSGMYQEPRRDDDLNYILTTGMEAIWVLTHEAAWNEAGYWKFVINDLTYTFETNEQDD
ncbi:hypothetical protein [Parabacteroides goldsteinii]|uniref:hypothetical protein n=1 Tax=Parabacteroides goldsteinii TaxID=328812 RepID=UPI001DBC5D1C|nr:hypothetical protein [Parabacteroides goldsteinii]MBS6574759.1 hypothetical protein [Parabacteroides goldsteinii]